MAVEFDARESEQGRRGTRKELLVHHGVVAVLCSFNRVSAAAAGVQCCFVQITRWQTLLRTQDQSEACNHAAVHVLRARPLSAWH